jgi:uncharacterized protein YjeT (DUF2065 family)
MEPVSSLLEAFALLLGLGMAGRIVAVIWPARTKELVKQKVGMLSDGQLRVMGVALIVLGVLASVVVFSALSVTEVAAVLFAFSFLAGGCLLLVPRLARSFWKEDIEMSDAGMRMLAAITTVIGLIVVYFVLR